jgi:hypothetical protein
MSMAADKAAVPSTGSRIFNSTYLRWAALGGFVGAVFMALIMIGAGQALTGDGVAIMCSMGVALIGLQPTSAATTSLGFVIHFVMGIVIGSILAVATLAIRRRLLITNAKSGLFIGLLGGFVVWLVLGLPMMLVVFSPAMVKVMVMMSPMSTSSTADMMKAESDAMMMLNSVMGPLIAAWLVAHLVFGGVWGVITSRGARASVTRA